MKLLSLATATVTTLALTADAARYKTCTESERQSIFGGLTNELKTCAASSTYDLTGKTLPTSEQRQMVCKCTDLVKRISDLRLPRCNLVLDGSSLSFKGAVTSIFTECGIAEPKEVPETLVPGVNSTDDSVASEATSAPAPSKSNSTSKSSSSGSGLDIETPKTPKPTKTPVPTTVRPDNSDSAESNSTSATPTPTLSGSPAGAITSAMVALTAVFVTFAML